MGGGKLYIYNNLLVYSPDSARANGCYYSPPGRTLEEHIALINTMKLEKATIIADDLCFLPRCPSLKYIRINYAKGIDHELDFSPLYELPEVESIGIAAPNREPSKGPAIHIDFTRLAGLRLDGGQTLPDLSFLRNMPKLRIFTFSMTVEDGDLRPCLDVPYVYCSKIKRHYNLKGKDLPSDESACGFELI